jgi:hypothetical protein
MRDPPDQRGFYIYPLQTDWLKKSKSIMIIISGKVPLIAVSFFLSLQNRRVF